MFNILQRVSKNGNGYFIKTCLKTAIAEHFGPTQKSPAVAGLLYLER